MVAKSDSSSTIPFSHCLNTCELKLVQEFWFFFENALIFQNPIGHQLEFFSVNNLLCFRNILFASENSFHFLHSYSSIFLIQQSAGEGVTNSSPRAVCLFAAASFGSSVLLTLALISLWSRTPQGSFRVSLHLRAQTVGDFSTAAAAAERTHNSS